ARVNLTPVIAAGGVAAIGLSWGLVEARSYTTRRVTVPVLPAGADPIRILHLSDLHLAPDQHAKARWVAALAREDVDLVIDTGDNLGHPEAVPPVLRVLDGLLDRPGAFVYGSNDYYAPHMKNPFTYFSGPSELRRAPVPLPTDELTAGLVGRGWRDLTNARSALSIKGMRVSLVGLDDPHLDRDVMPAVDSEHGDVRIGVVHAPYQRALDALSDDGVDLVLAGHTHGGQVCVPGWGALVTNCDLDTRRAKGLHRWDESSRSFAGYRDEAMWMHVSAGVGTSPFVRLRFACRPEATVLTLVPRVSETAP
ncbi:MAG: metallophosphoesterase, partial [Demequina sp.]